MKISVPDYLESDQEFHYMIMKTSGNKVITRLEFLGHNTIRTFRGGMMRQPQESLPEHIAIIAALEKGNGELAEKLVREHIHKTMELLKKSGSDKHK